MSEVIVRCSHCDGVMLTRLGPGRFESSLFYAVLGATRPLAEGGEATMLPGGKIIEIREAPGFCAQRCFEEIVRTPPPGGWRPVLDERPPANGWYYFRGWKYKVLWDHRSEIAYEPPLAPSVLTYTLRHPEAP